MRKWLSILVLLAFAVPQGAAFACVTDAGPDEPAAAHEHVHHDHGAPPDPDHQPDEPAHDRHHGEGPGCTMAMPCGVAALASLDAPHHSHSAEREADALTPITVLRSSDPTRDPPPPRRPAWN